MDEDYWKYPWSIALNKENGYLLQKRGRGTILGTHYLGQIDGVILGKISRESEDVDTGLTGELPFIFIRVGKLRKYLPNAGKGNVGLLNVELNEDKIVLIIADWVSDNTFDLWWIHNYFE